MFITSLLLYALPIQLIYKFKYLLFSTFLLKKKKSSLYFIGTYKL